MKAEDYFLYMDSDCLAYNIDPLMTIFPALLQDAIVIQYPRNCWRPDCYPIFNALNESSETKTRSTFNTQQSRGQGCLWSDPLDTLGIFGDAIDTHQMKTESILTKAGSTRYSSTPDPLDTTQGIIGDAIAIYSTTMLQDE